MTTLAELVHKKTSLFSCLMHKTPAQNFCKWCGASLNDQEIHKYPHPEGWEIDGHRGRWWLYVKCPICFYEWSLPKLRVKKSLVLKI